MGAFIIHGMIPGPDLFAVHADKTYPFIYSLFIANIVFLVVGISVAPYLARIALIPPALWCPSSAPSPFSAPTRCTNQCSTYI